MRKLVQPFLRLLGADILIDVQRNHLPALTWFHALTERPGVPGLVLMELIQDAKNADQVRIVENLVHGLPLHWPAEADCLRALADFRVLNLSQNLGLIDSLIAATTIGLGATLCTFNVKHYRNITGLVSEQPYAR